MGVFRKKTIAKGTEGGLKYICDVCSKDITATVRIRCSVCVEYDLCVTCFSEGCTSQNHIPAQHAFQVIEQHSIPIYDEGWGADEELCLLEGAEAYGLGSWADIADHIGGFRTKDEVRDHYIQTYIDSPNFPLPANADPDDTELATRVPREEFQASKKRRIESRKEAQKLQVPAPPKTKPTASQPSCHEVAGYMPGRLEFETEFANEAEEAVQHMQFDPGDGVNPYTGELEPEMELKMAVMDIYNARLTARADRKKVIFEHDLLDYRKNMNVEKRRTKEEKVLFEKVKPFVRMMNAQDFKSFSSQLIEEQNLRQAIRQLQEWRHMKICTLKEGEKYELDHAARLTKPVPTGMFDRQTGLKADRKTEIKMVPDLCMELTAPELADHHKPRPPGLTPTTSSPSTSFPHASFAGKAPPLHSQDSLGENDGIASRNHFAQIRPKYSVAPLPGTTKVDLTNQASADLHLLTDEEIDLCATLSVMPKPYLVMKEAIIKEALRNGGGLKRRMIKEICKIDPTKSSRLFDFFIHSGWIQKA